MKITLEIADDDIRTACEEAHSGYWGDNLRFYEAPNAPPTIDVHEDYNGEDVEHAERNFASSTFRLDLERGLRLMAVSRWGLNLAAWDGNAKDVFVQYAVFGKLVYS